MSLSPPLGLATLAAYLGPDDNVRIHDEHVELLRLDDEPDLIARGAQHHDSWVDRGRHVAYSAGWKKFERVWDGLILARQVTHALPVLEGVLSGLGRAAASRPTREPARAGR